MDLGLKDKVIIVSGGARGIGLGIVKVLAEEGAIPVILGKDVEDNKEAVQMLEKNGNEAYQVLVELTDPEACKNAVNSVYIKYGRIDGLVNNAGINDGISLEKGSHEEFLSSYHKNAVHYYMMAHYALPHLKKSEGNIVNIGSKVAQTGQGGTSAYAAANGARNALTREWAVELLKYNMRVNSVLVAECYTPMYEDWIKSLHNSKEKLEEINAKIPLGNRMTTANEIANMVVFLMSEVSSHTTGQLIYVDGGYTHLDRAI